MELRNGMILNAHKLWFFRDRNYQIWTQDFSKSFELKLYSSSFPLTPIYIPWRINSVLYINPSNTFAKTLIMLDSRN